MRHHDSYDRGYRETPDADRSQGRRGYGGDYRRGYDRGYGARRAPSFGDASFPMGPGYFPMTWGWYGPFGMDAETFPYGPPYAPPGYVYEPPPVRPEESPAYGRGGDREMRRWAREHGYDVEYTVYPRESRRRR